MAEQTTESGVLREWFSIPPGFDLPSPLTITNDGPSIIYINGDALMPGELKVLGFVGSTPPIQESATAAVPLK